MLPEDIDDRLFAKQVEVVADGICDALVLCFFEKQRSHPSAPWRDRQMRKVEGGLAALATWVDQSPTKNFIIGDSLTLADIAAGSVLGAMVRSSLDNAVSRVEEVLGGS
ncbi:hypothetical protein CLAFUW4_02158 [Fulvia fulva]|uniref:Glutathione S-transferase C-terminal domain-containing protein n=1 Tax=Passalora fulva TaxID=5499 RepID=A0A9Q8L6S3_PASFU|nr:uncharacterized protein CLAFUR5_02149 [Fulvia fulva]KAK4635122.1 hypothetical protein CLAFUR4_02154 [Fulvia fulva]KAK4636902.1 hypothetical protein CLAFUR0_02157 [Fulvia fulva]UJO11847.1 hypothetical protein CLAFUR5_02149 [Fulvia fulva]WPV08975.1 hypothetical protein CLAFUW4_02158 [Fulvia fulva]WPV23764.1 hypothetical protein CLAFUW7_02158 [Fulvia fulva]